MKVILLWSVMILTVSFFGCSEDIEENKVDFDQINVDESTNYRYIFKDIIEEDKRIRNKYKKGDFE